MLDTQAIAVSRSLYGEVMELLVGATSHLLLGAFCHPGEVDVEFLHELHQRAELGICVSALLDGENGVTASSRGNTT